MGARRPQKYWKTYYFVHNHFFEDKTLRRRFWDQLRPTRAPKGAKRTPKRDPRSTPKRIKTDIKIELNFDAITKWAWHAHRVVLWCRDPPQGGAPGALGRGPHGTGAAPRHPCGQSKIKRSIQLYKVYSIQGTGYSIQYTGYRVQGHVPSILGPVYRVLGYIPSIQCTAYRVQGYRVVEWVMGNRVIGRG